ncbi:OmpA family protein [Loktanella sp. S4079]|uniref:OmpA family protein n=1 Tax=Loktanella sp. S4079 TaxID=579483 RepID=UPI0005FA6511|nr:OmpA family protein [Loktanella sp. S4079]KJZ18261.1 membrane protein [Loktanella sp. S4079]
MKTLMTTAMAAALLAGCSTTTNDFPQLQYEAGAVIDSGEFGNATMNNIMVHSAQEEYRVNLARRFASEVDSTVNFEFNSAALDADARQILARQADWIRQFPEVHFRVYGHTDLVGSQAYNRRLGLRRAQAVVAFLTSQGIDRSRLEAVASFGETQPLIATNDRERRNRRTVTEVSGFVESNPLVLEGKYAQVIYREYVARATAAVVIDEATAAGG